MSSSEKQQLLSTYQTIVKKRNHFVLTYASGRKVIVKRDEPEFDTLLQHYQTKLERLYSNYMGGL